MSQRTELVGLQYLRGICALAVVVDHAAGRAALDKYFGVQAFGGILHFGALGVDIFFVISGFIITIVSLGDRNLAPTTGSGRFFAKRFARIVPLMWTAIISWALFRAAGTNSVVDPWAYFRAFFLIPYGEVDPNVIWTLRHEAIFYTIFAISFLGPKQMRVLLALWFLAPLLIWLFSLSTGTVIVKDSLPEIIFRTVNLQFGAGFLLGIIRLRYSFTKYITLPVHPFWVLTGLALIVMYTGGMAKEHFPLLLTDPLIGIAGAGVVWLATSVNSPPGLIDRVGEFLGNASYSIYLFHSHFESLPLIYFSRHPHVMPLEGVIAIVSIVGLLPPLLVYYYFERRLVKITQRLVVAPARKDQQAPA